VISLGRVLAGRRLGQSQPVVVEGWQAEVTDIVGDRMTAFYPRATQQPVERLRYPERQRTHQGNPCSAAHIWFHLVCETTIGWEMNEIKRRRSYR